MLERERDREREREGGGWRNRDSGKRHSVRSVKDEKECYSTESLKRRLSSGERWK